MSRPAARLTPDLEKAASKPTQRRLQSLRGVPIAGRLMAFVVTVAFAAIMGLPWFLICGCNAADWWDDLKFLYHQLSSGK